MERGITIVVLIHNVVDEAQTTSLRTIYHSPGEYQLLRNGHTDKSRQTLSTTLSHHTTKQPATTFKVLLSRAGKQCKGVI